MKSIVPSVRPVVPATGELGRPRATSRMLRDTRSGVLAARLSPLIDSREEIRRTWSRAAALAVDFIQNSGTLKGATDQVLADTVGVELQLVPMPNLTRLGYDAEETADWCALVKQRWKKWAWNPRECDQRGKLIVPQMIDIGLRWSIAYGEITGLFTYLPRNLRSKYGITTGTKLLMVPPHRLMQDTNEWERLYQGVFHDDLGRASAYKFMDRVNGLDAPNVYRAFDAAGRPQVMHIFDPVDADDVRGVSLLTPVFRKFAQAEVLDDAVLQTFILQTVFAAVLTSSAPSADAFEALQALEDLGDGGKDVKQDFLGYFGAALDSAKKSRIAIDGDPRVSHLAPGEDLQFRTSSMPSPQYLDFKASLSREMARAIGCTYAALSMDYTAATYSSTRMENASIWPIVMRRRERLAGPQNQMIYEAWLDEEIGERRIPLKGGYEAFSANRDDVSWAQWQGPAKPTADDYKSARAATERLVNGTSTPDIECAEGGTDAEEIFARRLYWHGRYRDAGMPSPFDRSNQTPLQENADNQAKDTGA